MKFIINETGCIQELRLIDAKTGIDCLNDVVGNSGAIGNNIIYDEEAEAYRIDQEDFEWWERYIAQTEKDAEELKLLREEFDHTDERTGTSVIDDIISRYYDPIDMESEHYEWERVFKIIRDTLD